MERFRFRVVFEVKDGGLELGSIRAGGVIFALHVLAEHAYMEEGICLSNKRISEMVTRLVPSDSCVLFLNQQSNGSC